MENFSENFRNFLKLENYKYMHKGIETDQEKNFTSWKMVMDAGMCQSARIKTDILNQKYRN